MKRRFQKRAERREQHALHMADIWWKGLHTRWILIALNPEASLSRLGLERRYYMHGGGLRGLTLPERS